MKYLQKQESFSFSTSSNSKTGFSSDDEDGGADGHNHTGGHTSGHHQHDYFEISLPPPPPPSPPFTTKTNHDDPKLDEFEFCFSFHSNSILEDFPTTTVSTISDHPLHPREPPITTSALASSQAVINVGDRKYNHHRKIKNSIHYKRIFQKASSPRCHHGAISPYVFPASRLRTLDKTQREVVRKRTWAKFDGIRKLMVKLRSIKHRLRSSLNVSRQFSLPTDRANKKISVHKKLMDCAHMTIHNDDNFLTNGQNRNLEDKKASSIVNFSRFSKMFDGIMKNIRTTRRSKQRDSKSCPESIKSSPMHDPNVRKARDERRDSSYLRDNSIQSAIAHCKKSFGK